MKAVRAAELARIKTAELGLNPQRYALDSVEGLACALRRAAAYITPCSPASLVRAVLSPLDGLITDTDKHRELIEEVLEAVVANGDIAEHEDISGGAGSQGKRLLYAAPPGFVIRKSGTALLLGITPDHRAPVPADLEERVEYVAHLRRLRSSDPNDLRKILQDFGLVEFDIHYWTRAPSTTSPERHMTNAGELLSRAPTFNAEVPGLTILDYEEPVRYYRGRWKEPKRQTGRYVGRRKQSYGADLWCYVELESGVARKFIDFPLSPTTHRACDHAWHLQMAIDAVRGKPQEYTAVEKEAQMYLQFFSPVPEWGQRRLASIGNPEPQKGCLFAYSMPAAEYEEERKFLTQELWMLERRSI